MSLVDIKTEDGILMVNLNRPEKRNALSGALVGQLEAVFSQAARNEDLRVVILSGAGSSFSAGADLAEMAKLDPTAAAQFIRNLHRAIHAVMHCPVPVIAAIQGACFGGALELAAGCDLRIATTDARFAMPEVKVGIPSVIEAALLPRLVGRGRAAWLVLTGETITATTAEKWGLVEGLMEPADFRDGARALARTILSADPAAVRSQKRLMRVWDAAPLDQAIEASVPLFAKSFESRIPNKLMAGLLKK
ncbi:MAG: enoyl-CoA hydratase-related protein [Alphaproteobacteria bacterium]|nr:enoyl-CoA hydratase-related protein [Alphaproteobacteria bacterium]